MSSKYAYFLVYTNVLLNIHEYANNFTSTANLKPYILYEFG